MYKGASRFLTRLKTKVANFSNFLRFRMRRQYEASESSSTPPSRYGRFTTTPGRLRAIPTTVPVLEDRLPEIGFEMEHRIALWIGESNHAGINFVRKNSSVILSLADRHRMNCSEIARHLNDDSRLPKPRSALWTDALVYHFTRHYMSIRPPF